MLVLINSNITSANSGTGTAYPSGAPDSPPHFCEVRIAQYLRSVLSTTVFFSCFFFFWPLYFCP